MAAAGEGGPEIVPESQPARTRATQMVARRRESSGMAQPCTVTVAVSDVDGTGLERSPHPITGDQPLPGWLGRDTLCEERDADLGRLA